MDPTHAVAQQRTPVKAHSQPAAPTPAPTPTTPARPASRAAATAASVTPPLRDHCESDSHAAIRRFLAAEHLATAEPDAAPLSWPRRRTSQTHPVGRLSAASSSVAVLATGSRTSSMSPGRPAVREQQLLLQQLHQHQEGHLPAPPPRFFRAKSLAFAELHPEAEPQDEVSMLREQVSLLLKSLEDEKKRRMHEHKLMQDKIIELQGLIRRNLPEQQKAQERRFVQMRSPSAARTKARSGSKHNLRAQLGRKSSKSSDELMALVRKSSKSSDELKVLVRKSSKSSDELQSFSRKSSKSSDELSSLSHHSSKSSDVGASSGCDDDSPDNQASHDEEPKLPVPAPSPSPTVAPVAPVKSPESVAQAESEHDDSETRLKRQLAKLRARMQAMVADAQAETETLRSLLKSERQNHERRERQLLVEANTKQYALEERHASAKERMSAKMTRLGSQISQLQAANRMLTEELSEKDARIAHLELAMGGMRIAQSAAGAVPPPPPQQQQHQHQQP